MLEKRAVVTETTPADDSIARPVEKKRCCGGRPDCRQSETPACAAPKCAPAE